MLTARNKKFSAARDSELRTLILTFSLREKEPLAQNDGHHNNNATAGWKAPLLGNDPVLPKDDAAAVSTADPWKMLPLPEGEGWGEGHGRSDFRGLN